MQALAHNPIQTMQMDQKQPIVLEPFCSRLANKLFAVAPARSSSLSGGDNRRMFRHTRKFSLKLMGSQIGCSLSC